MASGVLHGLSERRIGAEDLAIALRQAARTDPTVGINGVDVYQSEHGTTIRGNEVIKPPALVPGIIWDTGPLGTEADLVAPMYWVKLGLIQGADDTAPVTVGDSDIGHYFIVRATNIKESTGGSRTLAKNAKVVIFIGLDLDGQYRFYMSEGGSVGTQFKVTTAGLATCQAKTWDGTTLGTTAVTITNIQGHALNDILFAVPIANVSGMWLELASWSPSATQYLGIQVTDTTGHLGIAPPKYR